MADEHDDNQSDDLEISDEDAERLLADAVDSDDEDERPRRRSRARDDEDDEDSDDDASGLGVPGKRALEREKQRREAARAEAAAARQQLEDVKRQLEELQGGNKSELRRLIEERDRLKSERDEFRSVSRRREIAEEVAPEHATAKQIRLVAKYLRGADDDELEAAAEELFEQLAPAPKEPPKTRTPSKPKERLRGGGDPDEDEGPTDPRALADLIRGNR